MSDNSNENSNRLRFQLDAVDAWSGARATTFTTAHTKVETPIFMPVATHAALRAIDTRAAEEMGFQVLLANTYHLLLRPGPKVFEQFGGIHNFMKWPRAVLTDSGGFQIFSLSKYLRMTEEGARFRSYIDGREIVLTPETSIATQRSIGSDIMMVLDQCIDSTSNETLTRGALELTARWAKRSYAARGDSQQALFGIVQGACFPHLRRESADQITQIPFDGFAIGGLAVGETKAQREDLVEFTAPLLPANRPRYLMGVGTPIDLLEAVKRGVDMFDCIIPTSMAHQGVCYTSSGRLELCRGVFKHSELPLDKECSCSTCKRFSRAYLHHLIRAKEFTVDPLLALHNLTFYKSLMDRTRQSIIAGTFKQFYSSERERLVARDDEFSVVPPKVNADKRKTRILGDYEVVAHAAGYGSIKQTSSGEVMHSVLNPMEEAMALYIEQSEIIETVERAGEELVIWDVGLGAATNAMTCILELEELAHRARKVRILSFERDLDPLRLALTHPKLFVHLRHGAPHALVQVDQWQNEDESISWTLFRGDFAEQLVKAPAPDIIWYDPFSLKVDSKLWSVAAFEKLLLACGKKPAKLFTYTASTTVRAAMLAAGWYVGAGVGTGPKSETTVAYTPGWVAEHPATSLLTAEWFERWKRSGAREPFRGDGQTSIDKVQSHPQFAR